MYTFQMQPSTPTAEQQAWTTPTVKYEVSDYSGDNFVYLCTFEAAVRAMRRFSDAKITRISDNVVLAQSLNGGQ